MPAPSGARSGRRGVLGPLWARKTLQNPHRCRRGRAQSARCLGRKASGAARPPSGGRLRMGTFIRGQSMVSMKIPHHQPALSIKTLQWVLVHVLRAGSTRAATSRGVHGCRGLTQHATHARRLAAGTAARSTPALAQPHAASVLAASPPASPPVSLPPCRVDTPVTPTLLEHNHTAEFVAARPPLAGRRPGRPAACAAWPARI